MQQSKTTLYWSAQLIGWLGYACLIVLYNFIGTITLETLGGSFKVISSAILIATIGLGLTHLLRGVVLKFNWLKQKLYFILPLLLISSFLLGVVFHYVYQFATVLLFGNELNEVLSVPFYLLFQMVISWTFLLFFWSILYFAAHYFFIYRQQEIRELKLQANKREIELANLKAQLNPHFMFNALNSIRALVEESPKTAKQSITQLSGLLRAALNTGKKKLIPFEEELELVKNYLSLEKIRFEERLNLSFAIDSNCLKTAFPPLLLQTLVENGIKHGISKLPKGGVLHVEAKNTNKQFEILVRNSGVYSPKTQINNVGGTGLVNSRRRLNLLYGKKASLSIENKDEDIVETAVILPLKREEI